MSDAPNTIYLQWHGDGDPEIDNGAPEYADVTWSAERVFDGDIEYRRADIADDDTIRLIAVLEAEIARLRAQLAEWVERLRWADGLTDVVEQMREEAER